MSDDYNNRPNYLGEMLAEWMESNKKPTPLWRRVELWLFVGLRWNATRWTYPTLHGISVHSYPNWSKR